MQILSLKLLSTCSILLIYYLTITFSLFCFSNVIAQKPVKGDIGATAGLSAVAGFPTTDASTTRTLLFKYYVSDIWVARLAVNYITVSGTGTVITDSTVIPASLGLPSGNGFTKNTREISGGNFNLEIGLQKNFGDIDKVEIYAAAVFIMGLEGNRNLYEKKEWLIDQPSVNRFIGDYDEICSNTQIKTKYGGKFVIGANYFITSNFSLGTEFGYGYSSVFEQGGSLEIIQNINGVISKNDYSTQGFSDYKKSAFTSGAVLTLSFFF